MLLTSHSGLTPFLPALTSSLLCLSGTDGDFQFANEEERAENVNIGVSVKQGNTELQSILDNFLDAMSEDDFNKMMNDAIAIQPAI